jgi:hypothetical protein
MVVAEIFRLCTQGIEKGVLIRRESSMDKEFHFQNWFRDRLKETGLNFDSSSTVRIAK